MRMINTSLYMWESFFVSRSTRMLNQHIPSGSWSQVFRVNACLPLSPLLHLFYWSPHFPLTMCTFRLILLFVSFTLFISPASLFSLSLSTSSRCQQRNLSFIAPPHTHTPSSSNLVTRLWEVRKRKGACGKWGLSSCSSPFSSSYRLLFCREDKFVAHFWDKKEEWEMVQNSMEQRGRESQKVIFFEGLSGRVESEKRKGQEERGRMRRCQICLSL